MLLWGFGTPLFALFILKKNYKLLENKNFKTMMGFLYAGYRHEK